MRGEEREDLPKHQVQGGLLLDVVVAEGATVFKLLTREDQALLVGGDTVYHESVNRHHSATKNHIPLLILNLLLDIVDGVGRLHL